jgi:ADP-heptose:LPS heptosyltransferase
MGAGFEICDFSDPELETDYHAPLLSLPAWLHAAAPPSPVPYLFPAPDNVLTWARRIGTVGFRIGVCWQGSTGKADLGRSFPVRHFEGLSQIHGVRLISLHKGDGERQLQSLPWGARIETLGDDFDSGPDGFFDTAAVMKSLDLVITSDTAVAHLAGALGAPVWVALKSAPDWRWMTDRADNPWYPTMRLFRQPSAGDWEGVFAQMESALVERLQRSAPA